MFIHFVLFKSFFGYIAVDILKSCNKDWERESDWAYSYV